MGEAGYDEARNRARACRDKGERAGFRFWSKVAVMVADRTGVRVGEKVADRYAAAANETGRGVLKSEETPVEARRAVQEIARLLADLAHGRDDGMAVHNVGARARLAVEACGGRPRQGRQEPRPDS